MTDLSTLADTEPAGADLAGPDSAPPSDMVAEAHTDPASAAEAPDESDPNTLDSAKSNGAGLEPERPKRGRPRKSAARPTGVELVLTVTGGAEGTDWRAEVTHGARRVVKALPVPASAVVAAAKDLHPEVAEAIETVLGTAREQQRSRVEQLRAELEAAQRALAGLEH